MQKQISPKTIALTFGVLVICFAVGFYAVAWEEPELSPPDGNVDAPINTGITGQEKKGGLILNTGGADYGLIVESGESVFESVTITGGTFLPVCNASYRGKQYLLQSGSGITDALYICKKIADNSYAWMRMDSLRDVRACVIQADCEAGSFCRDGYCCNSPCDETCRACNVPDAEGYCTALTNYAEDNGCDTSCKGCVAGSCVDIPDDNQDKYGSNHCQSCKKCSGGSCVNVINNTDPYAECGGTSCCGYCSNGTCANVAAGSTCVSPGTVCTDTHYRCDGSGECTAPSNGSQICVNGCYYGTTCSDYCREKGKCGCYFHYMESGCTGAGSGSCGVACQTGFSCVCYECIY